MSKPSARSCAFDCPRLECREPETRGIPIFCNPEKRCLSRRRTCKHLTSCFAKSFLELQTAAMSKRTREKKRKAQSQEAEKLLPVETPFGSGIRKWQLPIDMMPIRVMKTIFPPNSRVESHCRLQVNRRLLHLNR